MSTHFNLSTPQRVFSPSSRRYPSLGRMGGLYSESLIKLETQRYKYRLGGGCAQQSTGSLETYLKQRMTSHMLVNQKNTDILPFRCETLESFLNSCIARLTIYHKKILLRVRRLSNMLA